MSVRLRGGRRTLSSKSNVCCNVPLRQATGTFSKKQGGESQDGACNVRLPLCPLSPCCWMGDSHISGRLPPCGWGCVCVCVDSPLSREIMPF